MSTITTPILKKLTSVPDGRTVAIILTPSRLVTFHNDILKKITGTKKINCVYVNLNERYPKVKTGLQKEKIDVSNFYFIDVTGVSETDQIKDDQCTYIQGPEALTQLSIAVDSALETGAFNLVILNSVTTLLIYNNLETVEKFARFIINKLKNYSAGGLVLFLDDEKSQKAARIIAQFCDEQIDLT